MAEQTAHLSEKDLFDKIAYLHDTLGLGFRKLSAKLRSEGIQIGKDKAHRIYRKYSPSPEQAEEITDYELKRLDKEEKNKEKEVALSKAKRETREKIAGLLIEKAELDFKYRTKLFQNSKILFQFSEKVLPVSNAGLWLDFTTLCAEKKIEAAETLMKVVGSQVTYEKTRFECAKEGRTYLFKEYLGSWLSGWLESQRPKEPEESTGPPEEHTGLPEDVYLNVRFED